VATTLCWDAGAIVAIGANDHDLTAVINRVIDLQGGAVVSVDGAFLAEIPLNIGGFYITTQNAGDCPQTRGLTKKR